MKNQTKLENINCILITPRAKNDLVGFVRIANDKTDQSLENIQKIGELLNQYDYKSHSIHVILDSPKSYSLNSRHHLIEYCDGKEIDLGKGDIKVKIKEDLKPEDTEFLEVLIESEHF